MLSPDLSPHREASLEWWFVQGFFEGKNVERRQFMVSLFRQAASPDIPDGHMLLVSAFDEARKEHTFTSQVSPALIDNFVEEAPKELKNIDISENLVQAYVSEIKRGGAPSPIKQSDDPVTMTSDRLDVGWGELSLSQNDDAINIGFRMPNDGALCEFKLEPQTTWLHEEKQNRFRFESMAYESCPRLTVTGTSDNYPVYGEAWIDHQWGNYGWLKTEGDESEMLGWSWFGINLNNRADLIVEVRHNLRTGDAIEGFAIHFVPGSDPRVVYDVRLTELRRWTSPKTMVSYPIDWRIEIPSLGVDLTFSPFTDDQEIPVFGIINTIWEGVGLVDGTIDGHAVQGRARLELQGYGNVLDFKSYQQRWVERIDHTLGKFLPPQLDDRQLARYAGQPRWSYDPQAQTEMLSKPVWDLVGRGGKHWRPIYGFLLLDALGGDAAPFETAISVIPEFIHNGSVIIDDIEDGSETRRGDETIHRRYGVPAAINAGNMLYFLPLLSLSDHPHLSARQRADIYDVIVKMFVQAHIGQAQDLFWSKPDLVRGTHFWQADDLGQLILQAHAFKTAASVRAISEVVCIIAQTDPALRDICSRFGESWGVAFQIVDDINNFTTRPEWGKVRGEDISAGKTSYVIHKAITMLEGAERSTLIDILENPKIRNSEPGLRRGIELVERSGALKACRAEAKALVETEWQTFSNVLPQSQSKILIRLFLTNLLDLPFEM